MEAHLQNLMGSFAYPSIGSPQDPQSSRLFTSISPNQQTVLPAAKLEQIREFFGILDVSVAVETIANIGFEILSREDIMQVRDLAEEASVEV